jgi:hypothetical protein
MFEISCRIQYKESLKIFRLFYENANITASFNRLS